MNAEPRRGGPPGPRRHHVQDEGRQQRLHRRERHVADRPEEGRLTSSRTSASRSTRSRSGSSGPISRSVIRDIFNEITSEEYYQVTIKNAMAAKAREALVEGARAVRDPHRLCSRSSSTASTRSTRRRSTRRSRPRPTCRSSSSSRRTWWSRSRASWRASAPSGTSALEDARGEAGRLKNDADGYYQTKTNQAKAVVAVAQAEAEGIRKEAEALGKLGGRRLRQDAGRQAVRAEEDPHRPGRRTSRR